MRISQFAPKSTDANWDLAAESIAVKIRWVGLVAGAILANVSMPPERQLALNLILLPGLIFTIIDTRAFINGRVFLKDSPLIISALESVFIGLLCYSHTGLESPFRYYYLLSLVCCAIRYSARTTFISCGLHCVSYALVWWVDRAAIQNLQLFVMMLVVMIWFAWAANAMTRLHKLGGERLRTLNDQLQQNQNLLETRIQERTQELEETQAQVLHQEKMAAFGLLAAGIAHEVGNPLTSISSLVQLLERRNPDEYTRERLGQVAGQLVRIQTILRELVTFSRPASNIQGKVQLRDVVDEALGIAKYYKGGKTRILHTALPDELPILVGVRDQLVQVVFNLILNAIDATGKAGTIRVSAEVFESTISLSIQDDGTGIPLEVQSRLFRPYFTTKKHGTGLGLFVTQKIVLAHGGLVRFESILGQGTIFRVVLPYHIEPRKPASVVEVQPLAVATSEVFRDADFNHR